MLKTEDMFKTRTAWYKVLVIDQIAVPLTKILARTNVTPNQITLAGFGVRCIAAWLVLINKPLWAFSCWQIGFLLDSVDGKLARLTSRVSRLGKKMDVWSDTIAVWIFAGAISVVALLPDRKILFLLAVLLLSLRTVTVMMYEYSTKGQQAYLENRLPQGSGSMPKYAAWTASRKLTLRPITATEIYQLIIPVSYIVGGFHYIVPLLVILQLYRLMAVLVKPGASRTPSEGLQ